MTLERTKKPTPGRDVGTWIGPALPDCPACGAPTRGRPFCGHDGTITGPFMVGERYVVEERIGSGGFAFVYGARHSLLAKPVAIKVLRPEVATDAIQGERFLREARTASQLSHENIVSIIDFGHDEQHDALYLVMERLQGRSLADVLVAGGAMSVDRAVPILRQLARALAAAHAIDVIHRDFNPRNVILTETSGRADLVKLCDFGISRQVGGGDRVTSKGTALGTPAYMAPEQIRGELAQDRRVDVYAFGVTAYEMLTGRLPYEAPTPVALIAHKLQDRPIVPARERVTGISVELDRLVHSCLAFEADKRPASMEEIERALAGLGGGAATAAGADLVGQMVGSYRVVKQLGSGGVGTVYLGEHPLIGTQVAIKVLMPEVAASPEMVERFIQEARASSQIGSPHIPAFFDFGRTVGGQPYAIMEYLVGGTVADRLTRQGPFGLGEVLDVTRQVATAMKQAHAVGIVHRDLKPENLIVTHDATGKMVIKVLDFGIAKLIGPASDNGGRTAIGRLLGTPYYCAPEQALGLDVGPSADVYALGVTIFEMLTGTLPFDGDTFQVLGHKTAVEAPLLRSLRPDLPEVISLTVAHMLARDPGRRIASMGEVLAAILSWPAPEPTSNDGVTLHARPGGESGQHRAATPSATQAQTRIGAAGDSLLSLRTPHAASGRTPVAAGVPASGPAVAAVAPDESRRRRASSARPRVPALPATAEAIPDDDLDQPLPRSRRWLIALGGVAALVMITVVVVVATGGTMSSSSGRRTEAPAAVAPVAAGSGAAAKVEPAAGTAAPAVTQPVIKSLPDAAGAGASAPAPAAAVATGGNRRGGTSAAEPDGSSRRRPKDRDRDKRRGDASPAVPPVTKPPASKPPASKPPATKPPASKPPATDSKPPKKKGDGFVVNPWEPPK